MDFGLDSTTGDLIVDGGLTLVEGADELQQRLKVGLTINLSEFFTHQNYGLPWLKPIDSDENDLQYFLGDSATTVAYVVSSIDDWIATIDQVESNYSEYSFNNQTRTLTYTPYITGTDGDDIDFPPYTLTL